MKVFLSWSGRKSERIAACLRDWLPDVLNAVDPWMSSEDIEKGAAGLPEIALQLKECSFGIVLLTQENQDRSWINYESGALSKSVGDDPGRVATVLIDIPGPNDVTGPLAQFQATRLEKSDIARLVQTINRFTEAPRPPERVAHVVESMWGVLEERISAILKDAHKHDKKVRTDRAVIDEILTISRELARATASNRQSASPRSSLRDKIKEVVRSVVPDAEDIVIDYGTGDQKLPEVRFVAVGSEPDVEAKVQQALRFELNLIFIVIAYPF